MIFIIAYSAYYMLFIPYIHFLSLFNTITFPSEAYTFSPRTENFSLRRKSFSLGGNSFSLKGKSFRPKDFSPVIVLKMSINNKFFNPPGRVKFCRTDILVKVKKQILSHIFHKISNLPSRIMLP